MFHQLHDPVSAAKSCWLVIKGGKYLETLAKADVLLIDKTGTLTLRQPRVSDVAPLDGLAPDAALLLAASAERYSEHPLAQALTVADPDAFTAFPGIGVQATVNQHRIEVGNRRLVAVTSPAAAAPEAEGKTLLYMACDGAPAAIFAAADTLRDEVPAALRQLRILGITHIELLTGDNVRTASALAERSVVVYRAELLPSTPSPRPRRSRRSASPDAIFRRSCGGYRRRPHMMIATPTMSIAAPRMS